MKLALEDSEEWNLCTFLGECCKSEIDTVKQIVNSVIESDPFRSSTQEIIRYFFKIQAKETSQLLSFLDELSEPCKVPKELLNEMKLFTLRNNLKRKADLVQPSWVIKKRCLRESKINKADMILNLPKLEVAEGLTDIMVEMMNSIDLAEFSGLGWMKDNKKKLAPTIMQLIEFFNMLSDRIATEIIFTKQEEKRVSNIVAAVKIAKHAERLHNYELVSVIVSTLQSCSVSRLKKTWNGVPKKYTNLLAYLEEIVSPTSNYQDYRREVKTKCSTPIIPILAVVLKDIFVLESNAQPTVEKGKVVYPLYFLRYCELSHYNYKVAKILVRTLRDNLPATESQLIYLSYHIDPPKDKTLIESIDPENTISLSNLSNEQKDNIFVKSYSKAPKQWSRLEVLVNLEYWEVSPEQCESLVDTVLKNGEDLLAFDPNPTLVPTMGMRKLILRKVKALKEQQILFETYGAMALYKKQVETWTKEEVFIWIKHSSFHEYGSSFKNVSGEQFLKLTAEDLTSMGVPFLGHRKSLLREIKSLAVLCKPAAPFSRPLPTKAKKKNKYLSQSSKHPKTHSKPPNSSQTIAKSRSLPLSPRTKSSHRPKPSSNKLKRPNPKPTSSSNAPRKLTEIGRAHV